MGWVLCRPMPLTPEQKRAQRAAAKATGARKKSRANLTPKERSAAQAERMRKVQHLAKSAQQQAAAMRRYLNALEAGQLKGPDPERLRQQLAKVEAQLIEDPLKRVLQIQQVMTLTQQLAMAEEEGDMSALEDEFVLHVKDYSDKWGIGYKAWRKLGVPVEVLRRGGFTTPGKPVMNGEHADVTEVV